MGGNQTRSLQEQLDWRIDDKSSFNGSRIDGSTSRKKGQYLTDFNGHRIDNRLRQTFKARQALNHVIPANSLYSRRSSSVLISSAGTDSRASSTGTPAAAVAVRNASSEPRQFRRSRSIRRRRSDVRRRVSQRRVSPRESFTRWKRHRSRVHHNRVHSHMYESIKGALLNKSGNSADHSVCTCSETDSDVSIENTRASDNCSAAAMTMAGKTTPSSISDRRQPSVYFSPNNTNGKSANDIDCDTAKSSGSAKTTESRGNHHRPRCGTSAKHSSADSGVAMSDSEKRTLTCSSSSSSSSSQERSTNVGTGTSVVSRHSELSSANACMADSVTPVYLAAQEGHLAVLRCLVQQHRGSLVHLTTDGMAPIHAAAQMGRADCLQWMVEEMGVDINMPDEDGATALHFAASRGHCQIVSWLLSHGAAIAADSFGKSPIDDASENGHMKCVSLLVRRKNIMSKSTSVVVADDSDATSSRQASPVMTQSEPQQRIKRSGTNCGGTVAVDPADVWSDSSSSARRSAKTTHTTLASVHVSAEDTRSSGISCGEDSGDQASIQSADQGRDKTVCAPRADGLTAPQANAETKPNGFFLHTTASDSDCRLRLLFNRGDVKNQLGDVDKNVADSASKGDISVETETHKTALTEAVASCNKLPINVDSPSDDLVSTNETLPTSICHAIEEVQETGGAGSNEDSSLEPNHALDNHKSSGVSLNSAKSEELNSELLEHKENGLLLGNHSQDGNCSISSLDNDSANSSLASSSCLSDQSLSAKLSDCLKDLESLEQSIPPPPGFDDNRHNLNEIASSLFSLNQENVLEKSENMSKEEAPDTQQRDSVELSSQDAQMNNSSRNLGLHIDSSYTSADSIQDQLKAHSEIVMNKEELNAVECQPPLPPKIHSFKKTVATPVSGSVLSDECLNRDTNATKNISDLMKKAETASETETIVNLTEKLTDSHNEFSTDIESLLNTKNRATNGSDIVASNSTNSDNVEDCRKVSRPDLDPNAEVNGQANQMTPPPTPPPPPPPPPLPPSHLLSKGNSDSILENIKRNRLINAKCKHDLQEQVPRFIPPTFSTPANSETLIKPSEYLRSLTKTPAVAAQKVPSDAKQDAGTDDKSNDDQICLKEDHCCEKQENIKEQPSSNTSDEKCSLDNHLYPDSNGTVWTLPKQTRPHQQEQASSVVNSDQDSLAVFLDQVPVLDPAGTPIPQWKRLIMARKAAERASSASMEASRASQLQQLPAWKQQLLERRQSVRKAVPNMACT